MKHSFLSKTMSAAIASVIAMGIIAVPASALNAAGSVAINEKNFPDKVFRTYVSKQFDKNKDKSLSQDEISKAKKIHYEREFVSWGADNTPVYDKEAIKSLKGIEFLTDLENIDVSANELTSIDVSKNKKLLYLYCSENAIGSIDVSKNLKLKSLYCSQCNLTKIDLSRNTELENLDLSFNIDRSTADYANRTAKSGLKSLDLSNNKKLSDLSVMDCYLLSDLKLGNPSAMRAINLEYTSITKVDLAKMKDLQIINIAGTKIKGFVPSKYPDLNTISVAEMELEKLDVSKNPQLQSLFCSKNNLKSLDLSKNPLLAHLDCVENKLTKLDLSKNPRLEFVYASDNQLTSINVSKCKVLDSLTCYNNKLTKLDITKCPELRILRCWNNKLSKIDLSKNKELVELDLANIPVVDITNNKKLESAHFSQVDRLIVPFGFKSNDFGVGSNWKPLDKDIFTCNMDDNSAKAKKPGNAAIEYTFYPSYGADAKTAQMTVTVCYKDVTKNTDFWFDPTYYLTTANVVKGYDKQTKFKPENDCTRAQMVTFLWRLSGSPAPKAKTTSFTDVKKSDYFYKAVIWAVEQGITTGISKTKFAPSDVCTRAQTVTFLWRMANKPEPSSAKNKFSDVKSSDYFYKAVLWASGKKLVAGYSDGTFQPKGKCSRRQMVTFLYKYDKYVNGKG